MYRSITYFLFCIFIFLFISPDAKGQHDVNWYFGQNAAIKFTTNGVVTLQDSRMDAFEGSSVISDRDGNLLMYTNGRTIWNKKHEIMKNGDLLFGSTSAKQSSIIVPMPGNTDKYYVFTSPSIESHSPSVGHSYSIVDMKEDNGNGAVIVKNQVFQQVGTEGLTAIQHANRKDYWIITHEISSPVVNAYLLTENGLNTDNVFKSMRFGNDVLPVKSENFSTAGGQVGVSTFFASPDSRFIVKITSENRLPILYRFNPASGSFLDAVFLELESVSHIVASAAFSVASDKLYLGSFKVGGQQGLIASVHEYQITETSDNSLRTTYSVFPDSVFKNTRKGVLLFLKLAPDGRIYFGEPLGNSLGVFYDITVDNKRKTIVKEQEVLLPVGSKMGQGFLQTVNKISQETAVSLSINQLSCKQYEFILNNPGNVSYDSIKWYIDGTTINKSETVLHTFKSDVKTAVVSVTLFSPYGLTTISTNLILSPPDLLTDITIRSNQCVNDSVEFSSVSSQSGASYFWDLGDGIIRNEKTPVKSFDKIGSYTIKSWVSYGNNCLSDTISKELVINKQQIPVLRQPVAVCAGEQVFWYDSSLIRNTGISSWHIGINDSIRLNSSTGVGDIKYRFANGGTYNIKYWLSGGECKTDTFHTTITIYSKPNASFVLPENCVKDISVFTDSTSVINDTISQWKWNFGDISSSLNTSSLQNPSHKYGNAGHYQVSLAVVTASGCSDSLIKQFTVNGAVPEASIQLEKNSFCAGDTIMMTNTSKVDFGGFTRMELTWKSVETFLKPLQGSVYKRHAPVFYQPADTLLPLHMKIFSGINCSSELDTLLRINAIPDIAFSAIEPLCLNASPLVLNHAKIVNEIPGTGEYTGDLVSGGKIYPALKKTAGNYPIQYRFTSTEGCSNTVGKTIQLLPVSQVNAGDDKIILEGDSVELRAIVDLGQPVSVLWKPQWYLNQYDTLVVIAAPPDDIYYTIQIANTYGCITEDQVFIRVLNTITPPNAFSPNGDGIHDKWEIPSLLEYTQCRVHIFDRYGKKVFFSQGYNNSWDGTYNNKPLPIGTYYYVIETGTKRKTVSGSITIIR